MDEVTITRGAREEHTALVRQIRHRLESEQAEIARLSGLRVQLEQTASSLESNTSRLGLEETGIWQSSGRGRDSRQQMEFGIDGLDGAHDGDDDGPDDLVLEGGEEEEEREREGGER